VAKILVADDNSNIQKMVTLALKDQGIDVVAVGNGEAAVRKISDIKPDLVLADVFMPVRNGYEVCQYVKTDPLLAHIPVILLVGAFDPLDEQEAQRVGADGVLKKPFVPPDPLISMVKSALTRAGVAHGTSAVKAPEPEAVKATEFPGPRIASMPTVSSIPAQAIPVEEPIAVVDSGSFVDEVPVRPEPIRIDSGSQPVAFGNLLETPAEDIEQDPAFLPPVNPELALERDWRDKDVEEADEEEEDEKPAAAWRPDGSETFGEVESPAAAADWRAGGFEQIKSKRSEYEAWESEQEKPSVVEAAKTAPEVSKVVEEPREPAATIPEVTPAVPAAPFSADAWAPAIAANSQPVAGTETLTAVEEATHTSTHGETNSQATAASTPEVRQPEPEQKSASSSWFSATSSPWDAEIEKANKLASAWDATVPAASTPAANNGTEKVSDESSAAAQVAIEKAALPAAAVEALREEAAQVAEDAVQSASQVAPSAVSVGAPLGTAEAPAPSMDDLVAKVLANMSPEVLQAVTREILRPVVEAMVKEELKSKKS
jgi:CheY-like chemotaxis protein